MSLPSALSKLVKTVAAGASAAVYSIGNVQAAVYGGGGLAAGAAPIGGMSRNTSVVSIVLVIIAFILNIIVIIAILAIIIAGVYLIVSGGDEGQKDKAKKIILYAMIGIVVIVLARVIVLFADHLFR